MKPLEDSGIYEVFIPGLGTGELYKFAITTKDDKILFKADPYASALSSGQEPPPSPPISPAFPGAMRNGWRSGSTQSRKKLPWPFMRSIWAPGERPAGRKRRAIIHIKKRPTSWPTMW